MYASLAAIDYKLLTTDPPQLVDAILPSLSTNEVNNALNFLISLPPNIIESVSLQNVFETLFQKSLNSKYVLHYVEYSNFARIFNKISILILKSFERHGWKIEKLFKALRSNREVQRGLSRIGFTGEVLQVKPASSFL